ncbi:MAG TPA: nuclear transport factor 2 family protein [Stenotrophomonas sp.]|nr:nuclear transport factor 2 family protein [Stenotrophomonas sp.]
MKAFCLLVLLLALLPTAALASASADIAAIHQAERDICAAYERADADGLERHLDPSFTLIGSTGKLTTRADEVADLRGGTRYSVFRNRDSQVRLYGDAAVVTGITHVEGRAEGQPYALDFQFTDTYVRRSQGWVMVASHASRRAPP